MEYSLGMRSEKRYSLQIVRRAADSANEYDHDITNGSVLHHTARYQHYSFRRSVLVSVYKSVNLSVELVAFNIRQS